MRTGNLGNKVRTLVVFVILCALCGAVVTAVGAANNPPVAITGGPYDVDINSGLLHLDGSASYDPDAGDSIVTYAWDLDNDGSFDDMTGATPFIPWVELEPMLRGIFYPGTTPISLQVSDSSGLTGTASTTLTVYNPQPIAAFTINPNPAADGQVVTFDGSFSSAGSPNRPVTGYNWQFWKDGVHTTASGQVVTKTFGTSGTCIVTLTVIESASGLTGSSQMLLMIVPGQPGPVAVPGGPYSAPVNTPVTLDGTGSYDPNGGTIDAYDWDTDGDGMYDDATGAVVVFPPGWFPEGSHWPRLRVTDNQLRTGNAGTRLTVYGVPAASFTASPETVGCGVPISFDALSSSSGSSSHDIILYEWDFGDGTTASSVSATASHFYTRAGSYTVTLTVTDDNAPPKTASTSGVVSLMFQNRPPVANAGGQYITKIGYGIVLDGTLSLDPNAPCDHIVSYQWELDGDGSYDDVTAATPYRELSWNELSELLHPQAARIYPIYLKVTDAYGLVSAPAETSLTISTVPVASFTASPDPAVTGETITFDASSSIAGLPGHSISYYAWDFGDKEVAGSTEATVTHYYESAARYPVTLTVTDEDGEKGTVTKTISVVAPNQAPIADPGGPYVRFVTDMVTLDGSGSSDPDEDYPLTYAWTLDAKPAGSVAALSDPALVNPSFVLDKVGSYTISLVVTDALGLESGPASVTVTTVNRRPWANAGPDQPFAVPGAVAYLDGTASFDPDGDPITYTWTMTNRPVGSSAALLDPASSTPSFTPDLKGAYVFSLVVMDPVGDMSESDSVTVTAVSQRPRANAGPDQTITVPGAPVSLDGTASFDPDGDYPLTYVWTLDSKPDGSSAIISVPSSSKPSFIPDLKGSYVFTLIVIDFSGDTSLPDTVTVTLTNAKPVADAGADQTVPAGSTVTLDGSGSHDADGDPLTYAWAFTARPAGSAAALSDPTVTNPSFTADRPGDYTVQLVVNDGFADSDPDTVTVHATQLGASVNIDPDTLNIKSKGGNNAVTVYIELAGADVTTIDASSVTLTYAGHSITAQASPTSVGDENHNGIPDRMVKFNRQDLIRIVEPGQSITLTVKGMAGGTAFEGTDTIRVIG